MSTISSITSQGLTGHYPHRADFRASEKADARQSTLATTWGLDQAIISVTSTEHLDSSGLQPTMLEVVHEHGWANHVNCKMGSVTSSNVTVDDISPREPDSPDTDFERSSTGIRRPPGG
ncbi:MAG TPA: hypothetical protein VGB74_01750 [Actinoplanes sp.]